MEMIDVDLNGSSHHATVSRMSYQVRAFGGLGGALLSFVMVPSKILCPTYDGW